MASGKYRCHSSAREHVLHLLDIESAREHLQHLECNFKHARIARQELEKILDPTDFVAQDST